MKKWLSRSCAVLLVCLSAGRPGLAFGADEFDFGGVELARLISLAMENNPDVGAARNLVQQYEAAYESERGFFDPEFSVSAGRGRRTRPVPWSSLGGFVDNNSVSGQAGLEFPFLPGAYFSVGVSERYLMEPGGEYDSLYQTVGGGQLWIPLLRDRGLAEWRARERAAMSRTESAGYALVDAMQTVRWLVELAYVDLLRSAAGIDEARSSAGRAEKLLEEAEAFVALKAVPSYQLHPAKMEVELNREALIGAKHVFESSLLKMSALIGVDVENDIAVEGEAILRLAAECVDPVPARIEDVLQARGAYLALQSSMRAVESEIKLAEQRAKSDLGVSLKAVWQGESEDSLIGTDLLISERHFGTEAALVWRRPLGFRSERADVAAHRAASRVIAEEMRRVRLNIESDLAIARDAFESATKRLDAAHAAADAAEKALLAEDDRFRLGEGRSRNVLDAQKDLTAVERRRNNAAAELLRAFVNARYISGYTTTTSNMAED